MSDATVPQSEIETYLPESLHREILDTLIARSKEVRDAMRENYRRFVAKADAGWLEHADDDTKDEIAFKFSGSVYLQIIGFGDPMFAEEYGPDKESLGEWHLYAEAVPKNEQDTGVITECFVTYESSDESIRAGAIYAIAEALRDIRVAIRDAHRWQ